jgi:hypothetical protein
MEYQYYEFQALDRPLDQQAMAALRAITSRAQITPTSLINVYHFGDFKGNPDRLMDQYFDAFFYLANWGTRRLMLRLPGGVVDLKAIKPYEVPHVLKARATKTHVVLDFHSAVEGEADDEGGEGWLASLLPLRAGLLAGDLRCLYLGWLAGVEIGEVDEEQEEPPVPPGLQDITAPLQRFIDFLRLDPDLLEVAAETSPGGPPSSLGPEELASWVAALPGKEKDRLLLRAMQGEGTHLGSELVLRFRQDRARDLARVAPGAGPARRTVVSLLEARDRLAEEKQRRKAELAAREKARRQKEQAAARARHLDSLRGREEEVWQQVESAVAAKQAREYDRAVTLLKDLRDLGEHTGTPEGVAARIRQLRQRHGSKRTLIERLNRAGLPG